jgi:hypothetical protein
VALIYEIADGIIIDKCIDVPSFYDGIKVKLNLRFRVRSILLGLFAGKTSKKQENCKKAAATNQHREMKILNPGQNKKGDSVESPV